jgi:predicted nucleotide-binding protein (sugar kinase/HSP70/actin superfamily)
MSKQEIIAKHVLLTAGNACGTCRFAMYEAEYRLALKNAGFDGFRVYTFNLVGGLTQKSDEGPGLEMNLEFFLGMINAIVIGDLLNEVGYRIRPYEVQTGETNRVLEECIDEIQQFLRRYRSFNFDGPIGRRMTKFKTIHSVIRYSGEFYRQLFGRDFFKVMEKCGKRISKIQVDRTRVKPTVKVTGEFWAHLTEGDGNFNMFRFLEREGAQVIIEPVASLIQHMMRQIKDETRERIGVQFDGKKGIRAAIGRFRSYVRGQKKIFLLYLADRALVRKWNYLRRAFGNLPHALLDQYELLELAHQHYNSKARGGESHLEIAKNIYYHKNHLCHMVLSLKPFGCMPSSQSDGVQAAVVNRYKDMIFLPIETAGEGEINAHSRVQMALGEAKAKAKEEFATVLAKTKRSLDEIQSYMDDHPKFREPFREAPHYPGISGTAANFILYVSNHMR